MMEEACVKPKRRPVGESDERMGEDAAVIDDLVMELADLGEKTSRQHTALRSKRDAFAECKSKTKRKVCSVFDELKLLLEAKEREALDAVDEHFSEVGLTELESHFEAILADKSRINRLIKDDADELRCDLDGAKSSLRHLKRYAIQRDNILNTNYVSKVTINEDTSLIDEVLQQWKCVIDSNENRIHVQPEETASGMMNNIHSVSAEAEVGQTNQHVTNSGEGHVDNLSNENSTALERRSSELNEATRDDVDNGANTSQGTTATTPSQTVMRPSAPVATNTPSQAVMRPSAPVATNTPSQAVMRPSAPVATNTPSQAVMRPSAPPLPSLEDTSTEPEAPPPYWQAIGLSGPHEAVDPAPVIPDLNTRSYPDTAPRYFDVMSSAPENQATGLPCNTLEHWHSFPSKRQFDHRSTTPIALTWNFNKICLGDRGNRKVKFFSCAGELLGEIVFNGEIHDVSFLEMFNNEYRYIVSLAKMNTFCIVALKADDNSTKLVRRLTFRNGIPYNCICRGPREQTLVGGTGLRSAQQPCVDLMDFDGYVLTRFSTTPDFVPFAFPKTVLVYSQFIIISDYKLNVVCVFCSDGSPVGQYSGTPTSPLIDPLSLTVDPFGNLMILHGKMPTVHVIDMKCSPIEVIKIPVGSNESQSTKLIAFDTETKKFATVKSNGQLAIYAFRNGYQGVPQGAVPEPATERREPAVLPLVEGMLPSTIENIRSRGRTRGRTGQFHL